VDFPTLFLSDYFVEISGLTGGDGIVLLAAPAHPVPEHSTAATFPTPSYGFPMPPRTRAQIAATKVTLFLFYLFILHSSYLAYGTSAVFSTTSMASRCAPALIF
jgi:hypothetical protein